MTFRLWIGMCMSPWSALYSSVDFALALRSDSGVHLRFCSNVVTLVSLVYVLVVNLAALLWTFSILLMLSSVCGSYTELLYSNAGLT